MLRRFLASPVDWFIAFLPIVIAATGVITIYTITFSDYHSKLAVDQIISIGIGLVAMLVLMFTDYRVFRGYGWLMYVIGILLLLMLIPPFSRLLPFTDTTYGATRWINLGFFQLQPSEIFKFLGIFAAAAYLAKNQTLFNVKKSLIYILIAVPPLILVLIEPNLSTTMVLFTIFVAMFLTAKPPIRLVAVIASVMLVATPIVYVNLKPYQRTRIEAFINPSKVSKDKLHNVKQAKIAIGSGGLSGRGFGQGSQTVLNFLPVAHSDFIFAGFAEAMGFVGSLTLIVLYGLLIWRIIIVAQISVDPFGKYVAIGVAAKLFIQVVIHIGVNTGLMPATGIPLPFMSYGGTAMIIDLACIGVVESIHIRHKKFVFG